VGWRSGLAYLAEQEDDDDADEHDGDSLLVAGRTGTHLDRRGHGLTLPGGTDHDTDKQYIEDCEDDERHEREHGLIHIAVADTIAGRSAELRVYLLPLTALLRSHHVHYHSYNK